MTQDHSGRVYIGTEDHGIWRLDLSAKPANRWIGFAANNDSNAYALAVDKSDRLWTGSLNSGVSVFNGQEWRDYGPGDGPLGERVFAIAVCPTDGDVWIATNAGLTRYIQASGEWRQYTRMDGLPSAYASCLAFDATGNIFVGTRCDGIAMADAADGYAKWRIVRGPRLEPTEAQGDGLPGNLINCLLATRAGMIFAGTPCGLARSADGGKTWKYWRGTEYAEKVEVLKNGPPPGWTPQPALLACEYVTSLAEDDAGKVWIGYRESGCEVLDPKSSKILCAPAVNAQPPDYVRAILPVGDCGALIGTYGTGLGLATDHFPALNARKNLALAPAPLPSPAKPPDLAELNAMLGILRAVPELPDAQQPAVVELDDDWRTEGAWLGRHGLYWIYLYGTESPGEWGAGPLPVSHDVYAGRYPNASMYTFIFALYTNNPKSLELPPAYLHSSVLQGNTRWEQNRREAECNDGGFEVFRKTDGRHLYAHVEVPAGLFYLSLYNHNKDGHSAANRWRDFPITVSAGPPGSAHTDPFPSIDDPAAPALQGNKARGRIVDFWGGVWIRHLVRGPKSVIVEINRNHSVVTQANGIALDFVDEYPEPYFPPSARPRQASAPVGSRDVDTEPLAVHRLFSELEAIRMRNAAWWAMESRRYYAAILRWQRNALTNPAPGGDFDMLASCYFHTGEIEKWEKCQRLAGRMPPRDIERAIRWDEKTPSCSGMGRQFVSDFIAAQSQTPKPAVKLIGDDDPASPPPNIETAITQLKSAKASERERAVEALLYVDDEPSARALTSLLDDRDTGVCVKAAEALRMKLLRLPWGSKAWLRDFLSNFDKTNSSRWISQQPPDMPTADPF